MLGDNMASANNGGHGAKSNSIDGEESTINRYSCAVTEATQMVSAYTNELLNIRNPVQEPGTKKQNIKIAFCLN
jgi:hypothetical protein